jgi:phospholipase C
MTLILSNRGATPLSLTVEDLGYGAEKKTLTVPPGGSSATRKIIPLQKSHGWYDVRFTVEGASAFSQRFAGRLETGRESRSDPLLSGTTG